MAELTIEAGIARGLLKYAVARGAAETALCAQAGLSAADLSNPDNRTPLAAYQRLMAAAKALTGDPALALHFARDVDLSQVSIVGLLANASETMAEAFEQMNRFGQLAVDWEGAEAGDRFLLQKEADGSWLIDRRRNPNAFPELTETTFGRMAWGPRQFGVSPWVEAVQVTHADPGYPDVYAEIFDAPVQFGAPRNALRLNPAFTHHRVAAMPRYVFGVLSERAEGLLKSLQDAQTTRGQVESLLIPVLHKGEASMDAVAQKLGLSRQTLFRKLRAEGVTFAGVLDELRRNMAVHYLEGRKVSVNETAYLVGFSEPAAFSRAFKRWTGRSPSELRQSAAIA